LTPMALLIDIWRLMNTWITKVFRN
jgi:hypothetical protein